ncbi:MAG TPA: hypothetical protein VK528_13290 [Flavobacterium sp.]|nr:hypothetical protein [Flavobacterium sp.]
METNDLGNKKINNEQKVNEGFSGGNLPEDYNPAAKKLQQQTETDKDGNLKTTENKDFNSHPHPDNHKNRGNIEFDKD